MIWTEPCNVLLISQGWSFSPIDISNNYWICFEGPLKVSKNCKCFPYQISAAFHIFPHSCFIYLFIFLKISNRTLFWKLLYNRGGARDCLFAGVTGLLDFLARVLRNWGFPVNVRVAEVEFWLQHMTHIYTDIFAHARTNAVPLGCSETVKMPFCVTLKARYSAHGI